MSVLQHDEQSAPIDRAELAEISRGDLAVERRLLRVFRTSNDADVAALQAAVDKRDAARVIRGAHRVMGASRMAGATMLAHIGAAIAQAGQAGDWDAIDENMRALCCEHARIHAYFDAQLIISPGMPSAARP